MKSLRQQSGFTLLELLVALVLIVTVVGIVYGSVMSAARSSERTRQRLSQCQRSALALDEIASLLRCGYPVRDTHRPKEFSFTAGTDTLLRFVSLSRWNGTPEVQPVLNELILNQGQLKLKQSLLSPDLTVTMQTAQPQVLLDNVAGIRVRCWQQHRWVSSATSWPLAIHLDSITRADAGQPFTQSITVSLPWYERKVSP